MIVVICIPLILRKVPKNMWYGMRTPRSMNGSNEEWYAVNRDVSIVMAIAGLISAAADLALGFAPLQRTTVYAVSMAILLAAVIVPIVACRKRLF